MDHGRLCCFGTASCLIDSTIYLFGGARFCIKQQGDNWIREADESNELLSFDTGSDLACFILFTYPLA